MMDILEQFNKFGEDVFLGKYCDITRPQLCEIGNHSAIDSFFYCTTKLLVGDYVHVSAHVSAIGGASSYLKLDDFSFVAMGSRLICGSENYTDDVLIGPTIPMKYKGDIKIAPITFERFSGVGVNVVVMPGVTIAEGSVVGANSLVTKSTEPWTVYIGTPARPVKTRPHVKIFEYAKELGYNE